MPSDDGCYLTILWPAERKTFHLREFIIEDAGHGWMLRMREGTVSVNCIADWLAKTDATTINISTQQLA